MKRSKNNWTEQLKKLPVGKSIKVKTSNQRQAVMDAARAVGVKCVSAKVARGYEIVKFPYFSNVRGKTGPKYSGGERRTSGGTWVARITVRGKATYLGSFKTKAEAMAARRECARIHHGHYYGEFPEFEKVGWRN